MNPAHETTLSEPGDAEGLAVAGLFAGVGGLETGLGMAGHHPVLLCEIWEPARAVLLKHFPGVTLHDDVRTLPHLPDATLVAAGFPCTDLSPIGATAGIHGKSSGLVKEVLRLLRTSASELALFENVENLLRLHDGEGMRLILDELEHLGYRWAYRVVDSRFTGVPQRRRRVLILAQRLDSPLPWRPENVLLADDVGEPSEEIWRKDAYGFYWTEGRGGLGWAQDAIPTLKGGSTIGLPSAPAIWLPQAKRGRKLLLPSIQDGERLQGLPADWTAPARAADRRDHRWKLVGNAVTVGVGAWVGGRLRQPGVFVPTNPLPWSGHDRLPQAAWGEAGTRWSTTVSVWPRHEPYTHLRDLLTESIATPLSHRAAAGFLSRLDRSRLTVDVSFLRDVEEHVRLTRPTASQRKIRGTRGLPDRTELELRLRRSLHADGLRFRLHTRPTRDLPVRVTMAFASARLAVDVRECLHGCPRHAPAATPDERASALSDAGWMLHVVWQHADPVRAACRIRQLVRQRLAE